MVRFSATAAAAAALCVCLGGVPAAAEGASDFLTRMKDNFGTTAAPTGGISEAEAVQIALNRGAAIRAARKEGMFLTHAQVMAIGLEPFDVVSLRVEPDPLPVQENEAVEAATNVVETAQSPVAEPEAAPASELSAATVAPVRSPRPAVRPLSLDRAEAASADDTTTITTSGEAAFWRVTGERVNLRSGPGREHDVVAQLGLDTRVQPVSDTGAEWVEVRFPSGDETAWVFATFLTPEDG